MPTLMWVKKWRLLIAGNLLFLCIATLALQQYQKPRNPNPISQHFSTVVVVADQTTTINCYLARFTTREGVRATMVSGSAKVGSQLFVGGFNEMHHPPGFPVATAYGGRFSWGRVFWDDQQIKDENPDLDPTLLVARACYTQSLQAGLNDETPSVFPFRAQ